MRPAGKATPARVWITGASSGLGAALANEYAAAGATVLLTARGREALEETCARLPGAGAGHVHPADVTQREEVASVISAIDDDHEGVDLAILNAGTYFETGIDDFDADRVRDLFDLNFFSVVDTIALLLPLCRAGRCGHIAVVASVAGDIGLPYAGAYAASKSALNRLCQSLRPELEAMGVRISVINPGFVRTPLTDRNRFPMPFLIEPEEAAAATRRGLDRGRFEIRFPWTMSVAMRVFAALPDPLVAMLTRRMLR